MSEENKLPDGVKVAMYIIFDENKNSYGIIGAPGFLEEPARAYYALKCADKNLDEYYFKKATIREKLTEGVKSFQGKMRFRNFISKK